MFARRISKSSGGRFVLLQKPWSWGIILCLLLTGCGASSSPASAIRQPSPQPTPISGPFHSTTQTFDGAFTITLDITPNRSGSNVFTVSVLDNHTAHPVTTVAVTLYTTMQDMAMGTDSLILHADANGQFSAASNNLSMGGHWAIGIVIQTPDHATHKAGINLVMSA